MGAIAKKIDPRTNAGGRPRYKIDNKILEECCAQMGTLEECAAALSIDTKTLSAALQREKKMSFKEYFIGASARAKTSLRRTQFNVAVNDKNVPMLIFLGKNYLAQTDKQSIQHTLSNVSFKMNFGPLNAK